MEHKTGLEDFYVIKNNKKLRMGYTTGSCAAGAAKGAAEMVLSGSIIREISLMTPKGILLHLELHDITMEANSVTCAVRKQAGMIRTQQTEYWYMQRSKGFQEKETGLSTVVSVLAE